MAMHVETWRSRSVNNRSLGCVRECTTFSRNESTPQTWGFSTYLGVWLAPSPSLYYDHLPSEGLHRIITDFNRKQRRRAGCGVRSIAQGYEASDRSFSCDT